MARFLRWLVGLAALPAVILPLAAANPPGAGAFDAATRAYDAGFFQRAEAEFADFTKRYTNSPYWTEAVLKQARARMQLTNFDGAIDLLETNRPAAGTAADQFLLFEGDARERQGEYAKAAETYGRLMREYPLSNLGLDAALGEARAWSQLAQWPRVVELLQKTEGAFQTAARATPSAPKVIQGRLLLAEALLAQKQTTEAAQALAPATAQNLSPDLAWQRQYLLCRVYLAAEDFGEALKGSTNLLTLAEAAGNRQLAAESAAFQGGLFERMGRLSEARGSYSTNLLEGVTPARQREALAKITTLFLVEERPAEAAQTLEAFLNKHPDWPSADEALLELGELRLRQLATTPAPGATNALTETNLLTGAINAFQTLTNKFPQSAYWGKAQLGLGWSFWMTNDLPQARVAFQSAAERLEHSGDQATAWFKLGDTQFVLEDYTNAVASYGVVIGKFDDVPIVRTNLLEPALYQEVRAAVAARDLGAATNAAARLLALSPEGFRTDAALLLAGQATGRSSPPQARKILEDFLALAPRAPLAPEIRLAVARTYEQEGKWPQAIEQYDRWVNEFTNHPAAARAEYYRALCNWQAGDQTNALLQFTNFVARFPTNELAPLAQWWVADYKFRANPAEAENDYQLLFKTWPGSELSWQAQLMAGQSAMARQSYKEAADYFTNLVTKVGNPTNHLRWQALYQYGCALMLQEAPETNRLVNYKEAIRVFTTICESYPSNELGVLAWGEKANGLLQYALVSHEYDSASNAFRQVIESPLADFAARANARVGLGVVLEKAAETAAPADKAALQELALNQYLDVFFYDKTIREGETPSWFWIRKAGLEAGRLAEALQQWEPAVHVYERLAQLLPPMKPTLDKRIARAREKLIAAPPRSAGL